jgi:hypothetical protein
MTTAATPLKMLLPLQRYEAEKFIYSPVNFHSLTPRPFYPYRLSILSLLWLVTLNKLNFLAKRDMIITVFGKPQTYDINGNWDVTTVSIRLLCKPKMTFTSN